MKKFLAKAGTMTWNVLLEILALLLLPFLAIYIGFDMVFYWLRKA